MDEDQKLAFLSRLRDALCGGGELPAERLAYLDHVRAWLGVSTRDFVGLVAQAPGSPGDARELLEQVVDLGLQRRDADPQPVLDGIARGLGVSYAELDALLAGKPPPRREGEGAKKAPRAPKRRRRGTRRAKRLRPEEDGRLPPLEQKTQLDAMVPRYSAPALLGRAAGVVLLLVAIPYGAHVFAGQGPKLRKAKREAAEVRVRPADVSAQKHELRAEAQRAERELQDRQRDMAELERKVEQAEREQQLLDDERRLARWKDAWRRRRGEFREAFPGGGG